MCLTEFCAIIHISNLYDHLYLSMDHHGERVASEQKNSSIEKNSRHDSDSDNDLERRSRKKGSKKSNREHKETKERREKKQKINSGRDSDRSQVSVRTEVVETDPKSTQDLTAIATAPAVLLTKADFFASLTALESLKPAVGTIHTVAKKMEAEKKTGSWLCPKCSTSNMNNSHQCHKCRAIKRMTEYR